MHTSHIGKEFKRRLSHVHKSQPSFFPYQVFRQLAKLVKNYDGHLDVVKRKKVVKTLILNIHTEELIRKIFHPKRLDGCNAFVKRKYSKVKVDGKTTPDYNGHSRIVVTKQTPVVITYNMSTECFKITYYIQRYNKQNEPVDANLQAVLNNCGD